MRIHTTLGLAALLAMAPGCGSDNNVASTGSVDDTQIDDDNDGYTSDEDCNDSDASVNPGETEVPYNGIDEDCNRETLDDDLDQDGYSASTVGGLDCNDSDASVNPDTPETCDEIDNNCDGQVDEGLSVSWYPDLDGDGYGSQVIPPNTSCQDPGDSYVDNNQDCDDDDAGINPAGVEAINGIDDDCDGQADLGATLNEDGDVFAGYTCTNADSITNPSGMIWIAGTIKNDPSGSLATVWVDSCGTWLGEGMSYGYWIPEGTGMHSARALESPAWTLVLSGDLCAWNDGTEPSNGLENYLHMANCSGE